MKIYLHSFRCVIYRSVIIFRRSDRSRWRRTFGNQDRSYKCRIRIVYSRWSGIDPIQRRRSRHIHIKNYRRWSSRSRRFEGICGRKIYEHSLDKTRLINPSSLFSGWRQSIVCERICFGRCRPLYCCRSASRSRTDNNITSCERWSEK